DVKKAEQIGILALGEYTLANLSDPITRGEMAKIIFRAYSKFERNSLSLEECQPLAKVIKDYDTMEAKYRPYALVVYGSGIISGYTDGRFAAEDKANRAQASAFIIRYLDKRNGRR
ncbi:MAG: S-layer homology domain-containing protein, partial [Acetivibrionales bacterium]